MSIEFVNFLLPLVSQVSTQILKDYMELEFLQSSESKNRFVQNSIVKAKEKTQNIFSELEDIEIVFSGDDMYNEEISNDRSLCFINLIDSVRNFSNALPYFATTFFISRHNFQQKLNHCMCIIYFPALQEAIYCVQNKGAFFMKFANQTKVSRLRSVSMQLKKHQDCYLIEGIQNKQQYLDLIDEYNLDIQNIGTFGSNYFAANLVVRKKITNAFLLNTDYITQKSLQLLTTECGMSFDVKENLKMAILSSKYKK